MQGLTGVRFGRVELQRWNWTGSSYNVTFAVTDSDKYDYAPLITETQKRAFREPAGIIRLNTYLGLMKDGFEGKHQLPENKAHVALMDKLFETVKGRYYGDKWAPGCLSEIKRWLDLQTGRVQLSPFPTEFARRVGALLAAK